MFYLIKCCNLRIKKRTELKSGTWFKSLSCLLLDVFESGSPAGEGQGKNWARMEIPRGNQETFASLGSNPQRPLWSLPP